MKNLSRSRSKKKGALQLIAVPLFGTRPVGVQEDELLLILVEGIEIEQEGEAQGVVEGVALVGSGHQV